MNTMKRIACTGMAMVIAILPAAAQAAEQTGTVPVVTLQQSIDAALSGGDEIRILQGSLDAARAQHALNISKNSFTLSGSAGAQESWLLGDTVLQGNRILTSTAVSTGVQAGLTLAGPLTSVSVTPSFIPASPPADAFTLVGVNVSQTIWNGYWGGPAQAAADKSLLTLQGREIGTQAGRLGIVYSVKQAYYALLAAQNSLALKKKILEKQDAVLRQIQATYDMKAASLADLKTAQLNARIAQVDVAVATHDLRFARITLLTLMGRNPDEDLAVASVEPPNVPVTTLAEAVAAGLSRRVELKQLELSLKSSSVDLALARGQGTPAVSVTGGVNMLVDLGSSLSHGDSVNIGVKISMPVLDAGSVDNQVKSILSQNSVFALQQAQLRKSITTAIQNAWEGVQLAGEKADVARMSVEATDLQYQLVNAQRDAGTASNQDLLASSVNLANAQNSLAAAENAVQLAVLQLQNVMGY